MNIIDDTRGQPMGIARFFLVLVVGAILYWIMSLVSEPILTRAANATSNPDANQATQWFQMGFDLTILFIIMLSFAGMIAVAVLARVMAR